MKVRKQRPAGEGGNGWDIVLEIGKRRHTSFFSNPDNSVDHAELEYFKGRYPMITTTARMEQFKRLYKNLWVIVTAGQYKLMQHMLGLDYKKKPFRNYGYFYKEQPDLEGLVNIGLATKRNGDIDDLCLDLEDDVMACNCCNDEDEPPYSKEDYDNAKTMGLDLDDWNDYVKYYGLGEDEEEY